MFLFPILTKGDGRLRFIANIMATGLLVLLVGLWFIQIVRARHFEDNSKRQSLKRVGIPAIRGRILDCNGQVLATSEPHYNAILYLEDLQGQFIEEYNALKKNYGAAHPETVLKNGKIRLTGGLSRQLQLRADCQVVSNITFEVSSALQDPRVLNTNAFLRHYASYPYVPFEIVPNLDRKELAEFAEQLSSQPELEIETQPVRTYPNDTLAAHVLGFVRREQINTNEISYTLPDYQGKTGVERIFDDQLRGQPGVKEVLVNSLNYRQRENVEMPNAPGDDIYLTIDKNVQFAAESKLAEMQPHTRGAVVVMDVRNGDVLAMASAPTYDPNDYVSGLTHEDVVDLNDPKYTPQLDRAVSGAYPPGSTFKIITTIACFEHGLDPNEIFDSPGEYRAGPRARPIHDTAGAGKFNFERAFYKSSNTYFIHYGLEAGLSNILAVARRFHLGEKTQFPFGPEVSGNIPLPDEAGKSLKFSSTPDVCIGQEITTTPMQMACMISAIANGGKIYWPRIAVRSVSPVTGQEEQLYAPGRLRDTVHIDPHQLELIHHAMLEDTEHPPDEFGTGGTAYTQFHQGGKPKLGNFHVAGKTGTAELKSTSRNSPRRITWFDSYGPYENPRYAVIVMVEDGSFGGPTCAPVAEHIYEALITREKTRTSGTLAKN